MKVTPTERIQTVVEAKPTRAPTKTEDSSRVSNQGDSVRLSDQAKHASRMAELKQALARNENIVNPERIAKAIVAEALN